MSERVQVSSGVDFCSLLTIVFIVLKLTGYITWSWWLVFAPLWIGIPIAIIAAIILIALVLALKQ